MGQVFRKTKEAQVKQSGWVLPIIVISQFCCTSLWFAGNGVMSELLLDYDLHASALGHLTSAVQSLSGQTRQAGQRFGNTEIRQFADFFSGDKPLG